MSRILHIVITYFIKLKKKNTIINKYLILFIQMNIYIW